MTNSTRRPSPIPLDRAGTNLALGRVRCGSLTPNPTIIREAIRGYCAAHRHAADTVDGITRWWLTQLGPCAIADVQSALEELVEASLIARRTLPDGTVLYGATSSKT